MGDVASPKEDGEMEPILSPEQGNAVNEWQTGLFDCWDDCHLTAVGLCCPQCLHADNATRMDSFASCCPYQCSYLCLTSLLLCSLVGGHHRRELRSAFSLPEAPCSDYTVHCFCSPCALCQEAREIKRRSNIHPVPGLAAGLTRGALPPEVQHMARTYSHGLSLEEWEWDSQGGKVGVPRRTKTRSLVAPKAKAIRRGMTSLSVGTVAGPFDSAPVSASQRLPSRLPSRAGSSMRTLSSTRTFVIPENESELEAMASSMSQNLTAAAAAAAERIRRVDRQQHAEHDRRLERMSSYRED